MDPDPLASAATISPASAVVGANRSLAITWGGNDDWIRYVENPGHDVFMDIYTKTV